MTGKRIAFTGPMFSAKTSRLIWFARNVAGDKGTVIIPVRGDRGHKEEIKSHDGRTIDAVHIETAMDVVRVIDEIRAIEGGWLCIDEVQFLELELFRTILDHDMINVAVAGLDLDFEGNEWPWFSEARLRDFIWHEQHAVCTNCLSPADRTLRKTASKERVLVGGEEAYEPRCFACWVDERKATK